MQTPTSDLSRRAFLAGALATAGGAVSGCSVPAVSDPTGPGQAESTASARSASGQSSSASASPSSTAATTSVQPRPDPSTAAKTATASEIIQRATVPVLCYHQLRNWRKGDSQYSRFNLICPPRYFRAQLDALADDGWTTISPDQYLAHLNTGAKLPRKPVILSFDDASAGHATEGLTQLVKRGMTGTFFVMTVVLGKPGWLSTRHVKRLAHAGMTIGSHTWDHHAVSDLSGGDWKVQLEQTRDALRKASGQPVEHFAYPYGVVSKKAFPHLSDAGYRTAFQLDAKKLDPSVPLYTLRRSIAVSTWSGASLLKHLSKQRP